MTWQDGHVIAKWKKFLADSAKQKIDIAARQIPPTDAAGKEHIAADEQIVFAREEAETARTMTRHFEHLKFRSKKISSWRLLDEEVRFGRLDF